MKLVLHNTLRRIIRFFKLSPKEKTLVVWIVFQVFFIKLKVRLVPLRKYYLDYFADSNHKFMQPNQSDIGIVYKMLKKLPFDLSCLEEAMLVKLYLKKLGADMYIYLGVKTDDDLKAHAWFLPTNSQGYRKIN